MAHAMKVGLFASLFLLVTTAGAHAGAYYGPPPLCPGTPLASNEARIFTGTSGGGTCYSLVLGSDGWEDSWTAWDATQGFPNDQIQSLVTGSGVNLVLFWNDFDTAAGTGIPLSILPNSNYSNLGSWNKQASAARIQSFPVNACTGASGNTLALFQNASYTDDCTELSVGYRCYIGAFDMGFHNDTLSSLINFSGTYYPQLWYDADFGGRVITVPINTAIYNIGLSPYYANDQISSISGNANTCFPI